MGRSKFICDDNRVSSRTIRNVEFLLGAGLEKDLVGNPTKTTKPILLLTNSPRSEGTFEFQRCIKWPVYVFTNNRRANIDGFWNHSSSSVGILGDIKGGYLEIEHVTGYEHENCFTDNITGDVFAEKNEIFLIAKVFKGIENLHSLCRNTDAQMQQMYPEACKIMSPEAWRQLIKRNLTRPIQDLASAVVCLNPSGQGVNISAVMGNTGAASYVCEDSLEEKDPETPEMSQEFLAHLSFLTGDNTIERVEGSYKACNGYAKIKCIKRPGTKNQK